VFPSHRNPSRSSDRAGQQPALSSQGWEPSSGRIPLPSEAPSKLQESTLEATVRAAQRGDGLALSALLDELMPYVGQICGVVALDRGEDAAQEALIAILRNIHRLREPAALFGWARTIATREAVRVARQSQRERPDPNLGDRAASAAGA